HPPEEQTISVWMGTEGKIDDVPVDEVRRFEGEFLQYLRHHHKGTLDLIADAEWNDDVIAVLDGAISHFKETFLAKDGGIRVNEAEAEAMAAGVEGQEKVVRVEGTPSAAADPRVARGAAPAARSPRTP